MPDDISEFSEEFYERLANVADWLRSFGEDDVGPTQDDVAEMDELAYGCHTCRDTGVDVPSLGYGCTECTHCYKGNHPIGLAGCRRCNSRGCVSSRMTRHGWSCQVCLCVPEHGTRRSWWRPTRRVHPMHVWTVNPIFVPTEHMGIERYLDDFTGMILWRESTDTREYVRCDPGLCMECMRVNFPDGRCHCLEAISWFERYPEDETMDPHGTFWR